nr:plasmid replication protein RepC [uncultured Gellertiella sp.]
MERDCITTPFGRRGLTLGMLASQALGARVDPHCAVDKWKLYRALCTAKVRLGLTDRALAIVSALMSFYPKPELSAEHGLVVFPSNAQLCLRANGMSEPTLRRHLAVLVASGIISRKDSANGKRYARRGGEGAISEAFGFSLAPLLARADEIALLADEVAAERIELQRLRERLTICRRDVGKLIATALEEGAPGDWERIHLDYRALVARFPRSPDATAVAALLEDMQDIKDEVLNRLEILANSQDMNASPLQNERHIQTSNPESFSESEPLIDEEQGESVVLETKALRVATGQPELKSFPLGMVLSACPDIAMYGPGGGISSWRDLMAAAVVVRTMLGVSPSAYQQACDILGPENAAAAMACILEKGGLIHSAGGYLRDLTRRAERGEFSLGPMLMALLRARGGHLRLIS